MLFRLQRKNYSYEQSLSKAAEHGLFDAAIIYSWNLFMLFIFEKVWQIREVEKENGSPYKTDKLFLTLKTKGEWPEDFFDGDLCSLNRLQENKQGEDVIVGRLKDIYKKVDQQHFRELQQLLQRRNTSAHVNSIFIEEDDLQDVLRRLIKSMSAIQKNHEDILDTILFHIDIPRQWYFSEMDMSYVDSVFDKRNGVDTLQYAHIARLISEQEFSSETVENIKRKAIEFFLGSNSFRGATENASLLIEPLVNYFTADDVRLVLEGVFDKRGHVYNQILEAGSIEEVFLKLYFISSNNFPELQGKWDEFVDKIQREGYSNNFQNLIKEMQEE